MFVTIVYRAVYFVKNNYIEMPYVVKTVVFVGFAITMALVAIFVTITLVALMVVIIFVVAIAVLVERGRRLNVFNFAFQRIDFFFGVRSRRGDFAYSADSSTGRPES